MVITRLAPRFFANKLDMMLFSSSLVRAQNTSISSMYSSSSSVSSVALPCRTRVLSRFSASHSARRGVVFDDFDVVFGFELLGKAVADVAAAGNHDAAGARFFRTQFAHDGFHAVDVGGKQDFIAFDDDGLRGWGRSGGCCGRWRRFGSPRLEKVLVDVGNFTADQQPAFAGLNNHHAHFIVGETEYLQ